MLEKIQKMAKLQNEAMELLKKEKVEDVISKMQEIAEETVNLQNEVTEKEKQETKEQVVEKMTKTIEVEVKKYADLYVSSEDFKNLLAQVMEAAELFKKVEEIAKTVDVLKNEEKSETSLDPAEVKKSKDKYSVWEWL